MTSAPIAPRKLAASRLMTQRKNGCLGGRQPKDVLAEDPEAVLAAAKLEVCGFMHG